MSPAQRRLLNSAFLTTDGHVAVWAKNAAARASLVKKGCFPHPTLKKVVCLSFEFTVAAVVNASESPTWRADLAVKSDLAEKVAVVQSGCSDDEKHAASELWRLVRLGEISASLVQSESGAQKWAFLAA